ncbi:hypothetical protein EDC96DRAFT_487483 [Choanephora cucurbitarum]|nr:hypothetical protein EDC96DRAFT_487483 [Choanephora cucurbitarum]
MSSSEWTILEKLLLSQAVYKYGEDNWFQIARNLKHHALLDRPSDYFNQKNCSLQYYLMIEDLEKEKKQSLNQDMPPVVRLARQLYALRLEELKKALAEDEEKFMTLVSEIDDIRAGKWDDELTKNIPTKTDESMTSPTHETTLPETELIQHGEETKVTEEMTKVEADNLENEVRDIQPEQPPVENTLPLAPVEPSEQDKEEESKKRSIEQTEPEEPEPKRQKTSESLPPPPPPIDKLTEDIDVDMPRQDYSTDVSQGTTPADTTDLHLQETESVAESESNAPTPNTERRKVNSKDDQRYKSWLKNINLLWREIANHKNGTMFMNPIKENIAPHYYDIVKRPMDLKTIKNKIRDGLINTTEEFERDVMLMINNSLMYNKEGTEVYQMAREMLDDAVQQIKTFKAADADTSTSSHTRAAKERRKSVAPIE